MYAVISKHNREVAEWQESDEFVQAVSDYLPIVAQNQVYKRIMAEKKVGRPGHYYGRDMIIEGAMPLAKFAMVPQEYGGNMDWWRDDKLFDDYMSRNKQWDWRKN